MIPETRVRGTRVVVAGLFVALLLGAFSATALDPSRAITQYHRQVWTAQQGLPDNSVNWLAQDAAGYLVVGTFGGAALFDGYRFQPLPEIDFDPRLYVRTPDGTEWFVGDEVAWRGSDGVVVKEGPFEEILNPSAVLAEADNTLLIGGIAGLVRVTKGSPSSASDPGFDGRVRAILRDSEGVLHVAGPRGFYRHGAEGQWVSVPGTEDAIVISCIEARDGAIWLGTNRGIVVVGRDEVVSRYDESTGMPAGQVRSVVEDSDGNIWAGMASNGVVRFSGDRIDVLGAAGGLPTASIRSLFADADGNIWIGTAGGGLVRLSDGRFVAIGRNEGLLSDFVFNVTESSDRDLWIGTNGGGLSRFRNGALVYNYGAADGLSDPVVQSVLETRDGRIVVGTRSGLFTLSGSRFRRGPQLGGLDVRYLEEGPDGRILLGTTSGLMTLSGSRVEEHAAQDELAITDVRTIEPARAGGFWIGGDGFGHFDGERIERLHDDELNEVVRDIHEDRDGALWLAMAPGVVRIEGNRITTIEVPGAIDRVVHAIVPDNNRRIWLPTNSGLVRADREQLEAFANGELAEVAWTTFNEGDGLPSGEFCGSFGRMWARDRNNRLWFASVAGAVSIDPVASSEPLATPPRLELVHAHDGTLVRHGEKLAAGKRRRLEFRYTAINLTTPEHTRFRYRLEPLDESWVDAGNTRDAVYRNLPPGTYRFRVMAAGRDGIFRSDPRPFEISIAPYFHERVSVRIGATLLLIGAFISVPLVRGRRMRERQAELQQRVEEKTKELIEANHILETIARTDTLTGLLNRRDFQERAEHEIVRVKRGHGAFAIILLDVDLFKQINDSFGHTTGDLLLAHVSGVLVERKRRQDLAGRWAGEQFILLLPDTRIEGAAILAEKIRSSIEHGDYSVYGGPESITATLGVTSFRNGESLEEGVHRADLALQEGKSSGRNCVVRRHPNDDDARLAGLED